MSQLVYKVYKKSKTSLFHFLKVEIFEKANKPFSLNLNNLAQKRSTQSFKKEIETRKKELLFHFFEN